MLIKIILNSVNETLFSDFVIGETGGYLISGLVQYIMKFNEKYIVSFNAFAMISFATVGLYLQ